MLMGDMNPSVGGLFKPHRKSLSRDTRWSLQVNLSSRVVVDTVCIFSEKSDETSIHVRVSSRQGTQLNQVILLGRNDD